MEHLVEESLAKTLDRVNESMFFDIPIPNQEQEKVTQWIIARLGQKGSYGGLFAPTEIDFADKVQLFMGEFLTTGASKAHILGEESMRVLKKMHIKSKEVQNALESAKNCMETILRREKSGMFCCGTCSVAYWRSLNSGCLDYSEERLSNGLKILKSLRDGKGRWRRFPFYYTLLALSEIDLPEVKEEFQYASQSMERTLNKTSKVDPFGSRRKRLVEGILSKL